MLKVTWKGKIPLYIDDQPVEYTELEGFVGRERQSESVEELELEDALERFRHSELQTLKIAATLKDGQTLNLTTTQYRFDFAGPTFEALKPVAIRIYLG